MGKKLIKALLLFLVVITCKPSMAQQCDWLNVEGSLNTNEFLVNVTTDNVGDVLVCGYYSNPFTVGTFTLPTPPGSTSFPILIKYDKDSAVKWALTNITQTTVGNTCLFQKVFTDRNNNIYALGSFGGAYNFGNGVSITSQSNSDFFLIKFNAAGTAQWARTLQGSNAAIGDISFDTDDNIYWGFSFIGTASYSGTSQTLNSNGSLDIAILKYSASGVFLSGNSYGGTDSDLLKNIRLDNANNVYILGNSADNLNFGGKSLSGEGQIVLKTDSSLTPINGVKTKLNLGQPYGMAVSSTGKCAVVSTFYDSVNFGNNVIFNTNFSVLSNFSPMCIVYYDSSLVPIWGRKNDTASSAGCVVRPIGGVSIANDNIYFGGYLRRGSIKFGDIVLPYGGFNNKVFITKIDTLGNFLWSFVDEDSTTSGTIADIEADSDGDVLITGYFAGNIKIFNRNENSIGTAPRIDVFTAKILDYSITRGFVKSGPYCAGDTLKVPYTKQGRYNIGNKFIAELSDSAGNFEGNQRELGRVTDTASGIINGSLPLFNVATTNKYRIRIISTDPVVQSFVKFDTLRLLIYSKDSANAGADQFICKGQQVDLGTTGGSRWQWTPSNQLQNPDDSSNRRPTTIPLYNNQEYRIIISDSSGCGDVDTDYVKINVRPYIETKIVGDSVVCRGFRQTLKAITTGGDSTKYWYQWKLVSLNFGVGKASNLFVRPATTTEYMVIVGDSCSDKTDTAYFTVKVETNLKANPSPDTTICKGKTAQLSVIGTGCNPDKYTYEWIQRGNSTVISNNDSIVVTPTSTTQYQVILKDTSTLLIDTATITVTVDSVFNITTTKDSTLCLGQSIDLTANVFSCDTSNMIYTWDNGLGTGKTKTISPTITTTYTVIGENTFNQLKDTAQVTITVRAPLNLTLNQDSTICIGEQAELRAITSGGLTTNHNIQWTAVGSQWSVNTKNVKVTPTQTTTYKAVLSDGCTVNNDSATITITVRPKLEIAVNQDSTICIGEEAELRAIPNGGLTTNHNIKWSAVSSQWSVNTKNATVTPIATTTYKAVLSDGCTTPKDSSIITITVRPKLTLTLNTDSTICIGEEAELRAIATGGDETSHNLLWSEVGSQWSVNTKDIKVSPSTTTTYKAVLSDNCTIENDSSEITITVRAPLQLTTTAKDSICSNEILLLTATPNGGLVNNYSIQWTTDNGLWTSTQNPATDTPQITTKYIAQLSDNCSPTIYDTLNVVVLQIPKADFTAIPISGCPPLTITLTDNSTDNDSTQNSWTIGSGEYQSTKTQTHELLKQGVYNIKLNVKNALGCSNEKTQQNAITVFAKPKANFIIKPDIKEVEEPLQLYNISQNYTSVIWDMGDGNIITPQGNGDTAYTYDENDTGFINAKIIAINNQGCRDTAIKQIRLYDKVNCTIPTAFTPNGDGLNNTFKPVCVGVGNYTLTIYNRWGQVIYQRENGEWDGNYIEQSVPAGVYMYKVQINAQSQKKKLTYGTVQLIR